MLERDPTTGYVFMKTFRPRSERDESQIAADAPSDPKLRSIRELKDREFIHPKDATDFVQIPPFLRVGPFDPILVISQQEPHTGLAPSCTNADDGRGRTVLPLSMFGTVVNAESPLMNQLFQLCHFARIRCCEYPLCSERRKRLEELAPQCDWAPFRDWALQLMACQLTMIEQGNFARPILRMSDAVTWCHLFLARVGRVDKDQSAKLAGPEKSTVAVDAFGAFETIYWMMTIEHSLGLLDIIEQTWDTNFLPGAITDPEITEASLRAVQAGICPNRFWNLTVTMERQHLDLPAIAQAAARHAQLKHEGHESCTPAFCTFTTLDSTRVKQCHKCPESDGNPCRTERKKLYFDPEKLDAAIRNKDRTVWSTASDEAQVSQKDPYIAISHVWSDGTGVGLADPGKVNRPGEVNECLFRFLARVVERLGCNAIWWDAISIPKDPILRQEEINNMHHNYSAAECTVIHDNYLLNFEWADDSEGPCLALVLCPWFTRGWTALELIMSKKVKVLYKNPESDEEPLIKDLDQDILAKDPALCTRAHWIASTIIRRLRRHVHNVSDLVAILKPRSTSWARDRMVIAGLLANVKADYIMATHEITKAIVDRVWNLNPASLLHGQPTITASGGWSWCPHSLYDMPSDTVGDLAETGKHLVGDRTCLVDKDGVLFGFWYWRPLEQADTRHDYLVPNSQHQSVSLTIRDAIRDWEHCMLLRDANRDGGLGLIVRPAARKSDFILAQYVGSVRVCESPAKLQGTPADERYGFDGFRIGAGGSKRRKALKFCKESYTRAPFSKLGKDCSWIAGLKGLWMGDHPHEGQLLITRHLEEQGVMEGLRLVVSGERENKNYALLPVEEPVFRVSTKSGNSVEARDDASTSDPSNLRVRSVKYQEQWPPEPLPAFGRVYHSDAVPAMRSFSVFKLETDDNQRRLYSLVIHSCLVPSPKQPYAGIWIYTRPRLPPLVALFYHQHSNHLQAIALTGDTSTRRTSLIFLVDDLSATKEAYPFEGEWKGMRYVDISDGRGPLALVLADEDEVVLLRDGTRKLGHFCRLKADDQPDSAIQTLLNPSSA